MANYLKPFVIDQSDIDFILSQVNFRPLFDVNGNAIILWDGTGSVYDAKGTLIGQGGATASDPLALSAVATYGQSYISEFDLAGLRDPSGLNNNLSLINATYGATDQIFTRSAAADYANYSPVMQAVADRAYAAAKQYYSSYSIADGTFKANLSDYTIKVDTTPGQPGDHTAANGAPIDIQNVVDYTPRMISLTTTTAGVTFDTWANHSGDPLAGSHQPNEIYYDASGVAKVLDWGQLKTVANGGLGQVDTQARLAASAGQDDHFIGGLNPGVSPSNGFFVLFGQFFDHGLDFIGKASGQTVKIALASDDPLYGMLGQDGQPVHEITINRATVAKLDANGAEYVNHTSPFIDQSQTYGSHEQLTNLLREWVPDTTTASTTDFHAGMNLFDGHTLDTPWMKADGVTLTTQTLPTLDELRAHIEATGRDALTWEDVNDLRNRDASGHVVAGTSGSALLLDMNPRFDAGHMAGFYDKNGSGTQDAGEASYGTAAQTAKVTAAIATIDASVKSTFGAASSFGIDPVTHKLTLFMENLPAGSPAGTPHMLSGASALYPFVNFADFSITTPAGALHDAVGEILMASVGDHYVAGDGRVNENFGLTSIHHVFHEEHNYQVDNIIDALHRQDIVSGDATHASLHGFQVDTGHGMNAAGDYLNGDGSIAWDQDKMFNAAKLVVEMEYQHAAVDQYARNVTPNIQEFGAYSTNVNSAISLEYSQVAFRFGHSTLRETIDTIDPTGGLTGKIMGYALKEAFLAPEKFADVGASGIILGMTHQQMNEVDEFVTPALNQGLLGQPLDLAAINIARGRDLGIPTLNEFRHAVGLNQYTSWNDFGQNMQHPSSLANFIAAYAFDGNLTKAQHLVGIVDGTVAAGTDGISLDQAYGFLNGDEAVGGAGTLAFNSIDTWLGGLAEVHQPGGLLGETFDKVFVDQIEKLMDGDRFYYLYRLFGTQFGNEVGNGQLKDIVERNTGLTHLNGNIFGYADQNIDLSAHKEVLVGSQTEFLTTANEHKYGGVTADIGTGPTATHVSVDDGTIGIYSNGGHGNLNDGHVVTIGGVHYIQDTRLADSDPTSAYNQNGGVNLDGTPNSGAESNEIIVGSKGADLIYGQGGDDTVYGDAGNDTIYGGYGIDRLYGGDGSDTIYGGDNPDLIDGGAGDDFLYGESSGSDINGNDQVIGGAGNDYISGGIGIDKLFGGTGDDRIFGDQDTDPFTHGDDGNDFIDGGSGTDVLYGDNGDDMILDGADVDISFGGAGDDIMKVGDIAQALGTGPDEVLGGDGVTDDGNTPGTTGFDIMDFSLQHLRPVGVSYDLDQQANPLTAVNSQQSVPAAFQIEGLVGSVSNDTLGGDAGNNWIVGGSGSDILTGDIGDDVIVGGSIRLDTLIGRYESAPGLASTYDHNNNNSGSTEADRLQDARYNGASHRVGYQDTLGAGLLGNSALGTQGFEKHFTEMLRSDQFKNVVLGDDGTAAAPGASSDTAAYTGNVADYEVTLIQFDSANQGHVLAYKIVDHGHTPTGPTDPLPARAPTDGTDILVGIQKLQFADGTVDITQLVEIPATGAPVISDLTPTEGQPLTLNISSIQDANGFNPAALHYQWQSSANGTAWTNIAGATAATFTPQDNFNALGFSGLDAQAGLQLRVVATFTDAGGHAEIVTSAPTGPVGAHAVNWASQNFFGGNLLGAFPGTAGDDIASGANPFFLVTNGNDTLNGLAGNDSLSGFGGNDILNGGAGNDALDGGTGNDTAVYAGAVANFTLAATTAAITVTDNTGAEGTDTVTGTEQLRFNGVNYGVVTGTNANNANLNGAAGANGSQAIFGLDGNDTINGGAGDDYINGGSGADTVTQTGSTGGHDFVDGGTTALDINGRDTTPDTYVLNGVAGAETFRIYSNTDDWDGAGPGTGSSAAHAGFTGLNANTEIVVARNGVLIAELDNIEEIVVNAATITSPGGVLPGGTGTIGGDTVQVIGNFTGTSLNYSTITVNGGSGADTVDISGLTSDHRIVFHGGGGNDQVIGTLRPQDVVDTQNMLPSDPGGPTGGSGQDGSGDGSGQDGSGEGSQGGSGDGSQGGGQGGSGDDQHCSGDDHDDGHDGAGTPAINPGMAEVNIGTSGADVMVGAAGDDVLSGLDGDDVILGNDGADTIKAGAGDDLVKAGAGDDVVFGNEGDDVLFGGAGRDLIAGDKGDDRIFGDAGDDALEGGLGNDVVYGGAGNDRIIATVSDGNDTYFGDMGEDTLDYSAISAAITADLGNGIGQHGSVASAQSGTDQVFGFENFIGGSGNDTIVASSVANVMDGGGGNDTFVFNSAVDADGDTIKGFQPGDRIDLSAIDANTGASGNQSFVLFAGNVFTSAGQVIVTHETRDGLEHTIVAGNTNNDTVADFKIDIAGNHSLTSADFNGVH
ncbi:MAG: heme peroxidase [Tardiphaga sp.]|nr:heme peroxidase [Tardiphaga sp.]